MQGLTAFLNVMEYVMVTFPIRLQKIKMYLKRTVNYGYVSHTFNMNVADAPSTSGLWLRAWPYLDRKCPRPRP